MPRRPERRDDDRKQNLLRIGCLLLDDRRELCLIRNISAGGALVRTCSEVVPGQSVAIEFKQGESVSGKVSWSDANIIGVMFNHMIDVMQLLADSSDWPRPRQPRVEIRTPVRLQQGGQTWTGLAIDLSQGGLKVDSRTPIVAHTDVHVSLQGLPVKEATCRWISSDACGLEFREVLPLNTLVRWVRENHIGAHIGKRVEDAA
jgi:hypothetical protein